MNVTKWLVLLVVLLSMSFFAACIKSYSPPLEQTIQMPAGASQTFTAVSSSGYIQWYVNDEAIEGATDETFVFQPDTPGDYVVQAVEPIGDFIADSVEWDVSAGCWGCCHGETIETHCGIGECAGTGIEVCQASVWVTLTECIPGEPSPEQCDGLDNDCNGAVDDGYLDDMPQTVCGPPECGEFFCIDGQWVYCEPSSGPEAPVCVAVP